MSGLLGDPAAYQTLPCPEGAMRFLEIPRSPEGAMRFLEIQSDLESSCERRVAVKSGILRFRGSTFAPAPAFNPAVAHYHFQPRPSPNDGGSNDCRFCPEEQC